MPIFKALIFIALMYVPQSVLAGEVEVVWHEPDNYRDVKPVMGGKERYRQNVFKQLDKHWLKLAEKHLPEGMKLKVKVTDLNLAGDVQHNFSLGQEIRLVKSIYWPSVKFEYQLFDGDRLVKEESVELKDMSFMDRGATLRVRSSFDYEKRILTDWFVDEVEVMLAQWKRQQTAIMS